jgi:NADPH-dependent 2,4-dienoyl-CoA reductase/sulfur reductase-like enzyme
MDSTRYLIVGGGSAGASAVEAIRARDHEGRIVLVSDERYLPYDRVPLSKEYLRGELSRENLFIQHPSSTNKSEWRFYLAAVHKN